MNSEVQPPGHLAHNLIRAMLHAYRFQGVGHCHHQIPVSRHTIPCFDAHSLWHHHFDCFFFFFIDPPILINFQLIQSFVITSVLDAKKQHRIFFLCIRPPLRALIGYVRRCGCSRISFIGSAALVQEACSNVSRSWLQQQTTTIMIPALLTQRHQLCIVAPTCDTFIPIFTSQYSASYKRCCHDYGATAIKYLQWKDCIIHSNYHSWERVAS